MNMMSVLLGATGLLLVAALVLSFGSMSNDLRGGPSQKEIAALRTEIEVLRAAESELRLLRQQRATGAAPAANIYAPAPVVPATHAAEDANREAENTAEIAALKQELADAKDEAAKNEKQAEIYKDEAGMAWQEKIENNDTNQRRARIIKDALLIATVAEWSEADGFVVINITRHESAQEGTVLAIRRNTGVIGQIKISGLYPDGAVADPMPGSFPGGTIDIQPGDELIIPPM